MTAPEPRPAPEPAPTRRLLVPLDGSPLAEAVLPAAEALAGALGADVTLLHVMERGAPATVHGHAHLNDPAQAEAYLDSLAPRFAGIGAGRVETHVHPSPENDVAGSIAQHAEEFGADLIVLCAHGEGGLGEWLAGAIALQTIRRATPPVLLIRPNPDGTAPAFAPTAVLVALDPAEHGEAALPPALAIARALALPVELLVVVPTLGTLGGRRQPAAMFVPTATAAALDLERDAAVGYLRTLATSLRDAGFAVTAAIERGDPATVVAERARRDPRAILTLCTHGRTGLDGLWSDSVGSRVVGRVAGPLLLAHPRR